MNVSSCRRESLAGRFPRTVVLAAALAGFALASGPAEAPAQEVRTWADSTGQFKIQAKFVSVRDGTVTLEEADGSSLEIELSKLSSADRKYVADRQAAEAANPFRKKAASPFRKKAAGAAGDRGAGEAEGPGASGGGEGKVVRPDWSGVRTLAVTPTSTEWKLEVVPASTPTPPAKPRPVPLPPKSNFFEGSKALVTNAAGTRAAVGYSGGNPGRKPASRVVLCDLENGKVLGSGSVPGAYVPLAVNDAGDRVLVRADEWGPGNHDRLELWGVGRSGIARGIVWTPYEGATGGQADDRDVRWAAFLDAGRLATVSEKGHLVIWQLDPLEPLMTLRLQSGCTPGLSPDRKRMAIATGKEIGVLDVDAGEVLALQKAPAPNMAWTSFAFSPSGRRLACQVFVSKVFTYEVADGSMHREVPLSGMNGQQPAVWTDDDHLLLGAHTLFDLSSQVRLWQYQGNEHVAPANGLCWFEVVPGQNQSGALVPARLPQPGVQDALARALKDPNFFIVKAGTSVSLDVEGIPESSRRDVAERLTKNLARNDVRVVKGGPLVVQASIEPGKEEEVAFRAFGAGFHVDKFKIRPQIRRLKFVYQGKVAWESSASTLPHFDIVRLKKDESLQDYVKKYEQPNYAYFGAVELPKLLTRPTGQATLGTSQVTLAGVR